MPNQAYFSILPASVRYDNRLKSNEKLIYCELTCLCQKEGYCWATNAYFAELYQVSKETVSRWLSNLQDCGYIEVHLDKDYSTGRRIVLVEDYTCQRSTPLDKKIMGPMTKTSSPPMTKRSTIIIQDINNTRLSNRTPHHPTLEEVIAYGKERNAPIDLAEKFFDYFTADADHPWIDGKGNPVKNWKQKFVTWQGREPKEDSPPRKEYRKL